MEVWYTAATVLNSLYPKIINVSKIYFVNILGRLLLILAIHYDFIIPCGCTVKVSLVPSWFPQLMALTVKEYSVPRTSPEQV